MIRIATGNDLDQLVSLLRQLFAIEEDFVFDPEKQLRGLELLLDCRTALVLVAEYQKKVIGMATAQLLISTAEGGPALLVEDVVVHPSEQNKGIGTALLQALGEWGASRGAGRMQLLADKNNSPALDYYLRRDWQQTQLICLRKYLNEGKKRQ